MGTGADGCCGGGGGGGGGSDVSHFLWPLFPPREERPRPFPEAGLDALEVAEGETAAGALAAPRDLGKPRRAKDEGFVDREADMTA